MQFMQFRFDPERKSECLWRSRGVRRGRNASDDAKGVRLLDSSSKHAGPGS